MSGRGTQNRWRKALGAIKDSTTVSLAKVSSDYKELDIAIVKATNHVERPSKEKHIRSVFHSISATRPRADVAHCIHTLAIRLAKTHNWAVALKSLIVIHRALREVDPTFHEELINYGRSRSHMLNMAHFKDDSSPNAWDYSVFVRTYALYLEERLECYQVLKYDVEMDRARTKDLGTAELLEHLPSLQQLLFRVIGCQPQGAAVNNNIIQLALSMVAIESIKLYQAISDGIMNLVDKFFEMKQHDAIRAFEIYRRAGHQAERLSEFYEVCKSLDIGRGQILMKIEQPPASFLQAMEEYVRDGPRASIARKDQVLDSKTSAPKDILAIEYKTPEAQGVTLPEPLKVQTPVVQLPDLLSFDDPAPVVTKSDEKSALTFAIAPVSEQPTSNPVQANGTTGWELALVSDQSSKESTVATSKLAGGLDLLTLGNLYDDAMKRSNQNVSYIQWQPVQVAGTMGQVHDPFFASNMVPVLHSVQTTTTMSNPRQAFVSQQQQQQAFMLQQQQAYMLQQQQQQAFMQQQQQQQAFLQQRQQQMMMMGSHQQSMNPYGAQYSATTQPYGSMAPQTQPQAYNPYTGPR